MIATTRKRTIKPMTPGIPQPARMRAALAGAVVTLGLAGVGLRAWALQVTDGDRYRELASRQHAAAVEIPAPRGDVIDAHGRPLAVSADADSVWANPREIRDVTETAARVAKLLGGEPAALEAKLAGDRRFVWLARHVAPEVAKAVRAAKLPGIEVAREPRRWYPGRTVGGPVIGRADIDGNGLDGIELAMNDQLVGKRGEGRAVRDARGRRMFADGLAQPEPGATVQLTLDRSIQAIADGALAQAVESNQARSGVAVVLDVATSRVLALASYPTYDSNTGAGIADGARNRAVTDAFEAGSVMKIFSVSAALEAGAVKPDTEFDLQNGSIQIGRATISDVHVSKYLTTTGIIKRSSNVGAVKIAQRLGRDRLYRALLAFGFGARTEIELPGEARGVVRPADRWRDVELATISYGYGLTVTPVQLAAGLAAIGDQGIYHAPRIVDRVIDADGTVHAAAPAPGRRVVSAATADAMRMMMGTVFEGGKDHGTASTIVVPGFRCAGKTGTARKYDPETKQYAKRYLASFAGLAPLVDPRLAIVVLIDEPTGTDYFGGLVAGPAFATIASEALRYLGVPGESLVCPPPPAGVNPALVTTPRTCVVPAPTPPKSAPAAPAPPAPPAPPARPRGGGLAPAVPDALAPIVPPLLAAPQPAMIDVPDFVGMGLGRALDVARGAGVIVEPTGGGRVVDQDPAPGAVAAPPRGVLRVILRFSDEP